jgi:hypothetical protein
VYSASGPDYASLTHLPCLGWRSPRVVNAAAEEQPVQFIHRLWSWSQGLRIGDLSGLGDLLM